MGKESTVNFQIDSIQIIDITGEMKLNNSEIERINETKTHYFIKFKVGDSLILPKTMDRHQEFFSVINTIAQKYNIPFNKELTWKWK